MSRKMQYPSKPIDQPMETILNKTNKTPDSEGVSTIEAAPENQYTGFLLWQVTSLWQRTLSAVLRPYGLTLVQYTLMIGIYRLGAKEESINQSRLARYTKLDMMMTSQVLRALANKGFVKRKMHPNDTRAKVLFLTPEGEVLIKKAAIEVEAKEKEFFSLLKDKRNQFNTVLMELMAEQVEPTCLTETSNF